MSVAAEREEGYRSPDKIFTLLADDYVSTVISDALAERDAAGQQIRKELSSRIGKLRVNGFRDPNRAPHDRLVDTVHSAIDDGDNRLAATVLKTWMEIHATLREAAITHLRSRGIDTPDAPEAGFSGSWTTEEWLGERDRMRDDAGNDFDEDDEDVALMLSLVSGRFPAPPALKSELFNQWVDQLWDLPAESPEWMTEAAKLSKWIRFIRRAKQAELIHRGIREIHLRSKEIETEFRDDLLYLGIESTITPRAAPAGPELTIATLKFLEALRGKLNAYRPLRPQAPSRDEEIERAAARLAAEEDTLQLVSDWRELVARADEKNEAGTETDDLGETAVNGEAGTVEGAAADPAEFDALQDEHERVQAEMTALREENGRLRKNNEELRAQSARALGAQCDGEVESLKDEITRSRRAEEQWRQAYVESRKGRRPEDKPVRIGSVRDAVALAREAFPDRLLIKLNTSSNEDTPFTNPSEVYDALAWLATAYRDANDKRIGEACSGWSCKKDQVENSIAKYREQYETVVDGKTWYLGAHVGKGTSRDPRYTIRIGFARDEENNRVVVGFIGQHQRNRQS